MLLKAKYVHITCIRNGTKNELYALRELVAQFMCHDSLTASVTFEKSSQWIILLRFPGLFGVRGATVQGENVIFCPRDNVCLTYPSDTGIDPQMFYS